MSTTATTAAPRIKRTHTWVETTASRTEVYRVTEWDNGAILVTVIDHSAKTRRLVTDMDAEARIILDQNCKATKVKVSGPDFASYIIDLAVHIPRADEAGCEEALRHAGPVSFGRSFYEPIFS